MHSRAEREKLIGLNHPNAFSAPIIQLADVGLRDGHDVLSDQSIPSPIRHQFPNGDGPLIGSVGALRDFLPLDNGEVDEFGPCGAALEQREKRSEHGERIAQKGDVQNWIASALEGSGWTVPEIMAGVQCGDFHLFMHEEGCMVGEFIVSPRHKVMHIFAAGGTLKAMSDLLPTVEAFGRMHGCDIGGATGRKGWSRYLKRFGYSPADPAVTKEL